MAIIPRTCVLCQKEMSYVWWELGIKEEIPVPGDGGGHFHRQLLQMCSPECVERYIAWNREREVGAVK